MAAKNLVIVESPAKAKTLSRYLGRDYVVKASVGHVVDLPKSKLGVDVENDFEPDYEVIHGKGKVIDELKAAPRARRASTWPPTPTARARPSPGTSPSTSSPRASRAKIHRVLFNEITKSAVQEAIENAARDRQPQVRGPAGPPRPRPPGRLPDQPAAVGQGPPRPVGRPRAVGRRAAHRRARARDPWLRHGRVLADHGAGCSKADGQPQSSRRGSSKSTAARSRRANLRADDHGTVFFIARRGAGPRARSRVSARRATGRVAEVKKHRAPAPPGAAVHHLDAAAGSVAQARLPAAAHDGLAQRLYEGVELGDEARPA